jgi:hypothetical protein
MWIPAYILRCWALSMLVSLLPRRSLTPRTSPSLPSDWNTVTKASSAVYKSWQDLSKPKGVVEHVSTKEVVQDFESIRIALGYEKISLLGAS